MSINPIQNYPDSRGKRGKYMERGALSGVNPENAVPEEWSGGACLTERVTNFLTD